MLIVARELISFDMNQSIQLLCYYFDDLFDSIGVAKLAEV